jgi:hypothetical protein
MGLDLRSSGPVPAKSGCGGGGRARVQDACTTTSDASYRTEVPKSAALSVVVTGPTVCRCGGGAA